MPMTFSNHSFKRPLFVVRVLWWLTFYGLATISTANANKLLVLEQYSDHIKVGEHLEYLEDPDGSLTLEEALKPDNKTWQIHQAPIFNQGYSDSVFWVSLRFKLADYIQQPQQYFLVFDLPFFTEIDYYLFKGEQLIETHQTGIGRPFANKPYPHESFVFPLQPQPNQEYRLVIRGDTVSATLMPLSLYQENTFHQRHVYSSLLMGFYFGLSIILAIYNFFLYIATKDFNYFLYTIHVFGLCWLQGALRGYTATYLWGDDWHWFAFYEPTFIIWASFCTSLLFTKNFLKLKDFYPRWNLLILASFYISLLFVFLSFIAPMDVVLNFFNVFSAVAIALIFSVAIYCFIHGNHAARFFLLGWSFFLISAAVKIIYHIGWLPTNFFTTHSMILGSALEGVLLSLALADRINWIQKERNAAQRQAVEALEQSNKIKDDFLISISHELRTPLAGIVGALSLTKNANKLADYQESHQLIEKSVGRITNTIDSILSLTEISSGDIKIQKRHFSLNNEINDLVDSIETICNDKQVTFNCSCKVSRDQYFYSDPGKIQLVLSQLLYNAVNFTNEGQISLDIEPQENPFGIRFIITDTGSGIAHHQLKLIFEAFQQGSSGYTRTHEGLGIGLTVCKRLLDLLNGTIDVKSKVGMGTHVEVFIPVEPGQAPQSPEPTKGDHEIHTLVVEDNVVNQKVLTSLLKKLSCQTRIANNGVEALDQVSQEKPDIIFMDCQMPVMDGIEATKRLRESYSCESLPIVAVTANAMSKDQERCYAAGMNDFLVKPVKLENIENALVKWAHPGPHSTDK